MECDFDLSNTGASSSDYGILGRCMDAAAAAGVADRVSAFGEINRCRDFCGGHIVHEPKDAYYDFVGGKCPGVADGGTCAAYSGKSSTVCGYDTGC